MPAPGLSVILPTASYETVRCTIDHLRAQNVIDRIELVLVAPEDAVLDVDEQALAAFGGGYQVVRFPDPRNLPLARARGMLAARAPLVVQGEGHCYPEPGWAQALLDAHRDGWTVVGPRIRNANPESARSWVSLYVGYGPWLAGERGVRDDLPGHNSAYAKAAFADLGEEELARLIEAETVFHSELRRRGHRLLYEPGATVRHLNLTHWGGWLADWYATGRVFAAARARGWPGWRRNAYALASPLIPPIRLARILGDRRRASDDVAMPRRALPLLPVALVASAFGELLGYAFGPGNSLAMLSRFELNRETFVD